MAGGFKRIDDTYTGSGTATTGTFSTSMRMSSIVLKEMNCNCLSGCFLQHIELGYLVQTNIFWRSKCLADIVLLFLKNNMKSMSH